MTTETYKPSKQEFHIPITTNDKTAVECLAESTKLSRQKLKKHMQKGCVWLERTKVNDVETEVVTEQAKHKSYIQRLRRAKKIVSNNDVLHFYYDETVLANETEPAVLISDLGDYSIWNKPSGMLSQGSKWGDHCTIYRWAEKHLQPERAAFVVHRLDRAANGLIILAHKKNVASQFSKMFEKREIDKRYHVEVSGDFSNIMTEKENVLTINNAIDGKSAISHVTMLAFNESLNTSKIEVQIETGRKHQIRKHLSEVGFAVVGDRLYGSGSEGVDLKLKAKSLTFICPVSSEERFFTLDS